ncbi:hypothetical protein M758_1G098700 [Ceratodon purpureus]|uniref:CTP synthase N-terminal domain-containing protein n=1 Tax=Ceratodon purpureus TaxID=3225 RepID=A0A8T0J6M5_CERPU|nr:hypothetical protein KC19_1G109300 [Ceratodon purpureus]KAG0629376.1 hypothetical protein M758_1G098700 [Ceratodon purpureus]
MSPCGSYDFASFECGFPFILFCEWRAVALSKSFSRACVPSDPYLNTDVGTMSSFEHREVFVLDYGGEVRFRR